ncbi:hypothetical protein GCM10022395_12800 [Snuella lapsa]|uniref:Uncharacterized protein n=1 Tax=Snuella lapsa TaxID=870481 RepID=A0ABP6X9T2_9FLAO
MKTVLVFKTSISRPRHVKLLQPHLDALVARQGRWNFDLEDCDNILRVESKILKAQTVCNALKRYGFYCEELH